MVSISLSRSSHLKSKNKTKRNLDIRDHAKSCEKTNDTRITGWVRMRDRVRVGLRSRGGVRVLGLAD